MADKVGNYSGDFEQQRPSVSAGSSKRNKKQDPFIQTKSTAFGAGGVTAQNFHAKED